MSTKKVGLLNFQYSDHNYGAVLQAAALEHIVRALGHKPQHLDFKVRPKKSVKAAFGKVLRQLGLRRKLKAERVANKEAFERFRVNFLNRTSPIETTDDFSKIAETFDTVIVGSDQVWRPAFARDSIAFFLGYVPQGVDRVSYAASFGTSSWELLNNSILTSKVRDELRRFKAISCREDSGVDICNEVFGVKAAHVLDPLLLVDDAFFNKIVSEERVFQNAKIVYYKLDASAEFQEDLKVIGTELEDTAVDIYLKDSKIREYREVAEWMAMIRGAELVISDSFHCICLALRFGKKVIYCPNEKRGQARLISLFNKLKVDAKPLDFNLKTPMFTLLKQSDIDTILETERLQSLEFLKQALCD